MKIHGFPPVIVLTLLLASFSLPLSPVFLYANDFPPDVQSLRREIRILDRTRDIAESKLKNNPSLTRGITTINRYISYLDARIRRLCAELAARAGITATADLKCPQPIAFLPGWQAPAAKTAEENTEELDRKLSEELGSFDEFLAEEQDKIASARQLPQHNRDEDGPPGDMEHRDTSGFDEGIGNSDQQPETSDKETGSADAEDQNQDNATAADNQHRKDGARIRTAKGSRQDLDRSAPPPISKDDDIVARQLREAAEKETDPRLKKRLWEEYRRYKEGVR